MKPPTALAGEMTHIRVARSTGQIDSSPLTGSRMIPLANDDAAALGLPGRTVTVGEMVDALERVAGADAVARIRWQKDPRITKLVDTWPGTLDAGRARSLGFPQDDNFEAIVRAYAESRGTGR